ncbi:MAG: heme NO-binding domain-containing protein [Actinomycetota bacterium]
MKGVIFNAAQEAVIELFDEDTWDDLLDAAGLGGVYSSVGTYPDSDLVALVVAATEATGLSAEEVMIAVGRKALRHLADRVPTLLEEATCAYDMLGMIHDVIHVEVMKLYEDAQPPQFTYSDLPGGGLRMGYRSPRQLDPLAEGLVHGVGDRFGEELQVTRHPATSDGEVFIDVVSLGPIGGG